MRSVPLFALVLALAGTAGAARSKAPRPAPVPEVSAPAADPAAARAAMAALTTGVKILLPLVATDEVFASPENEGLIRAALANLAEGADEVGHLTTPLAPAHAVSARVLGDHLGRTLAAFAAGRREEARLKVQATARACIQCHSQIPALSGQPLFDLPPVGLDPMTRGELLFAARRFDDALGAYRRLLALTSWMPITPTTRQRIDYERALERLLLIQLRVRRDVAGTKEDLERVLGQQGLAKGIADRVAGWRRALDTKGLLPAFDAAKADGGTVNAWAKARCGAAPAEQKGWDATKTVDALLATSVLYGYLTRITSGPEVSAALLVTARCEAALGRNFDVPLTDLYLEECVRRAPHTPGAAACLADLRAWVTHAGGAAPSRAEEARLAELAALAGASK